MPFASIHNRHERAVFDKLKEASARFPDLIGNEDLLSYSPLGPEVGT